MTTKEPLAEYAECRRHLVSMLGRANNECGGVCEWANAKDAAAWLHETRPMAYGPEFSSPGRSGLDHSVTARGGGGALKETI